MNRFFGVLAIALIAAGPLAAQTASERDLQALIFYLQSGDDAAVRAEMRRLRAQFPDWQPPSDLNELIGSNEVVDESPIWQRVERGDWAGARTAIGQLQARAPNWRPGNEMMQILELGEAQAEFDRAANEGRAQDAIAVARQNPAILRCDRINNAWQVAEMYRQLGQNGNALATYRGVLGSCTGLSETVPTLEKANEIASLEQLESLFEAARSANRGNTAQLNALEERLRAGRGAPPPASAVAAQDSAPAAAAASEPARAPAQAPAPAAAAPAPAPASVAAASPAPAGDLSRLPLRGDGRVAQVRAAKEAGAWAQCLAQSVNPRSVELLYERSWCAYNLERPMEALVGFATTARTGNALGGNVNRDANFGLILSYLALQMTEEAARLAAVTNLTQTQRVETETTILDQRGVRSYRLGEYRQAAAYFTALEQLNGSLRRDLAIMRAYSYLNSGNREAAVEEFERLHSELATAETTAGLNAARF